VAGLVLDLDEDEPEPELELGLVSLVSVSRVPLVWLLELLVGAVDVLVRLGAELLEVVVGAVLLGVVAAPGAVLPVGAVAPVGAALSYRASVAVAICDGASRTEAVEALAPLPVDDGVSSRTEEVDALAPLPADDPVEPSPSVSSSLARFASADCRLAFACSKVTSALCGSSAARS
jgi:hypothetical protein